MLVRDLHGLLADERLGAREHLVEHDAEGVDVAAGVGDSAGDELGGEVRDGAEQSLPRRGVGAHRPGEAEVAELDAPVVGEHDVLGLEVAMHDPSRVRRREAREHGLADLQRLLCGEMALLLQQLPQRDARQVLHDEVGAAEVVALIEDVHEIRVREPRGAARLLLEAPREIRVLREVLVHHLHRDAALQSEIRGEVHHRHAAPGDARSDRVTAVERLPDQRVGRHGGHPESLRNFG